MLFTALGYAQVGVNTNTPDASSALEIESTTGGILIPRLTQTQRDAITAPATGLMIYQTNQSTGFYFFDGTVWTKINGVAGPQGEAGSQGIQGIQGDIGLTGATGPSGANGANGSAGVQGPQGETGLQGIQGIQGDIGLTGATGPSGANGANGSNGIDGAQGAQGDTGIQGINGSTAYELWQDAGNIGTEAEFLASLVGPEGEPGITNSQSANVYFVDYDLESINSELTDGDFAFNLSSGDLFMYRETGSSISTSNNDVLNFSGGTVSSKYNHSIMISFQVSSRIILRGIGPVCSGSYSLCETLYGNFYIDDDDINNGLGQKSGTPNQNSQNNFSGVLLPGYTYRFYFSGYMKSFPTTLSTDNSIFLNLTCHTVSNFNNTSTDTEYSVSETSRVPYFYSGFNIVVGSFGGWIQIND